MGSSGVEKYNPTTEDFYRKEIEVGSSLSVLEILDTTGTKHFASMQDLSIKNGQDAGLCWRAFNPSTWGGRGRWISKFEASLVYRVSSRTAKTTYTEKPCLEEKKKEWIEQVNQQSFQDIKPMWDQIILVKRLKQAGTHDPGRQQGGPEG